MWGMRLPEIERWSERVVVVRGLNPGPFTGPGTNTYLVGTGPRPLLIDTGAGVDGYVDLVRRALREECGGAELGDVYVTHVHPDHLGGARDLLEAFGPRRVLKHPWPDRDGAFGLELTPLGDGDVVRVDGASLRAIHSPGHARDHLCFHLEEERALFTGDVILGAGTTVIPTEGGDMGVYLETLARLDKLELERIYPGHGPLIATPHETIREYIEHREERERQILAALRKGAQTIEQMVEEIYVDTPRALYPAAGQSVLSHLLKLEREQRAGRQVDAAGAERWSLG